VNGVTRTRAHDLALALRSYLAGEEEWARLRAYEVARDAMAAGIGVLEIVAEHEEALGILLAGVRTTEESASAVKASGELLAESLGPFEMAYRGFQEANESLLRVNADLTSQVDERKRAEESARLAREDAERANRAKDEFLSRMSHELRTPLNAILGFGQLLEMDGLEPDHQESVQQILKGGRHLLDLINEVLDIARIASGTIPLSPEPIPLLDALRETIDLIQPLAAEQGIVVAPTQSWPADCFVLADKQRLKQVLLNLLSNAVKYNRPEGTVTVRCVQAPAGRLRVEVADQGAGIAQEMVDRLFVPFDRLGAEATGIEGTGLGLAVSKRLVEAMDGILGVQSAPGAGSTFFFELPSVAAAELAERGVVPNRTSAAMEETQTILYIEDNSANFALIERALAQRSRLRLIGAMLGREGVDLAVRAAPALILLDLHLPDVGGEEVLRLLRADPVTEDTPVIVISADATPGRIRRLLAAGARAYLTKPLDMGRFFEAVDEALEARGD
jgi:signal transduction histidine kinase/ActR/RegA family two-component response regulator